MDFKAAYRRFRQWQLVPFDYRPSSQSQVSHRCNNCGNDFVGNFSPICSQKESVGPITWKSVIQSIGEVWGLNNRSMLYSLVQLFLRPGYFIGDYISGKKQVSFPPVKLLASVMLQVPPSAVCSTTTSILQATRCCTSTTPSSG